MILLSFRLLLLLSISLYFDCIDCAVSSSFSSLLKSSQSTSKSSDSSINTSIDNNQNITRINNTNFNANNISISTITWNLGEYTPKHLNFISRYNSSDIIAVGVQECEDIRPRMSNKESKKSRIYRARLKKAIGKSYKCISQDKLGGGLSYQLIMTPIMPTCIMPLCLITVLFT